MGSSLSNLASVALRLVCAAVFGLGPPSAHAQIQDIKPVTVARGLAYPWSLAFLPDGRMLVTERPGRLRIIDATGSLSEPVVGLPPIAAGGQCGLLDVAVDPEFDRNALIYFSYAEPGAGGNGTAVARARLGAGTLDDLRVIFRQSPKEESTVHCGSRLAFALDGRLFVTLGDRYHRRDAAQTLDTHMGKVVRIETDGRVPADNPFVRRSGARPEIWSLGHRNVQGAAVHPTTGALWTTEHGPDGGDELNLTEAGHNYGWPLVTAGTDGGNGTRIGVSGPLPGLDQAVRHWAPSSIAPSGMAFVTSDRYPSWKGQLLIGALRAQGLLRLKLDGGRVVDEERVPGVGGRIRDVRQGPDGWLYVVTDAERDGQVLRLQR